jgi:hypothetical protein
MGDISILEFIVYGFVTYSSLLMLIISVIKEVPNTRSLSIVRGMFLVPGIICAFLLAGSGLEVTMETPAMTYTNRTTFNDTSLIFMEITNSTGVEPAKFTLMNPIWVPLHYLFAIIMVVYFILQMLTLFTKTD